MKERPIIFSSEMVKAILEGRKTQTRRTRGLNEINKNPDDWVVHHIDGTEWEFKNTKNLADYHINCPYGKIGDRLWVRETWAIIDAKLPMLPYVDGIKTIYRADNKKEYNKIKWHPSIFMPRKFSRITLEITNIRVERVQDITAKDAYAEGARCDCLKPVDICKGNIDNFKKLWNSINEKKGYGWNKNPWVWVPEWLPYKKTN